MIESHEADNPLADLEAMIRSAGSYVQPAEDLRPRVLEAVRRDRDQHWIERQLQQLALCLVLLASLTSYLHSPEVGDDTFQSPGQLPVVVRGTQPDEAHWEMVDSFTQLRRRQAALLRFDL